jgi:hypothetical protein
MVPTRIAMNPRTILQQGTTILDAVLVPRGFGFEFRSEGLGSGGTFAWGEYVRDDRRLELHFRYSLGLVTYHAAKFTLDHAQYMAALGAARRAAYPGFSNDPLDAFRDLSYDLVQFAAADFLDGSASIFTEAAEVVAADAPRRQREYMAWATGDLSSRERARQRFHAGDYAEARRLLEDLKYPDLATKTELEMLRIARARTRPWWQRLNDR